MLLWVFIYWLNKMIVSFNQKIIDPASMPIDHKAFLNGFAAYETLRTYHQVVFQLKHHLVRLFQSAAFIGLTSPWMTHQIEQSIDELLDRSDSDLEKRFRIILADQDLIVMMMDLEEKPKEFYEKGVSLVSYYGVRPMPIAKILGDTICYMANEHAKLNDAYDSVLINPYTEKITECSYANLFWAKDNQLFTTDQNILEGVTRRVVIELVEACEYKSIDLDELKKADEVFITQTSSGILPINKVDNHSFNVGDLTRELMEKFNQLIWN